MEGKTVPTQVITANMGIRQVREATNDDAPIYDLSGRRVANKTLPHGIYIRNGKKFVMK